MVIANGFVAGGLPYRQSGQTAFARFYDPAGQQTCARTQHRCQHIQGRSPQRGIVTESDETAIGLFASTSLTEQRQNSSDKLKANKKLILCFSSTPA